MKEVKTLSELQRLFLDSILSKNMSLAYFLGVLYMMVESKTIKDTTIKGLKFVSTVFIINILGWLLNSILPEYYDPINPAIFFLTTLLGIILLKYWGELDGEWFGLPRYILIIGPLFGSQLLIQSGNYSYPGMIVVNSAYVVGSFILFVLVASIKEEILVSDASPVFKSYSTILAAIAMLALGVIGFQLI
jgi:Na+-translocating ferredoxin:NAD+ oxidoreductase RnfA subunit